MKPLIIGVGNPWRNDDGFGPAVIDKLRAIHQTKADLYDCAASPSELLAHWAGRSIVFVVDACRDDSQACGKILRFDALSEILSAKAVMTSSHGFSLAEVIRLARELNALPDSLIIYAVVGGDFSYGDTLTEVVDQAVDAVSDRILQEIATGV